MPINRLKLRGNFLHKSGRLSKTTTHSRLFVSTQGQNQENPEKSPLIDLPG